MLTKYRGNGSSAQNVRFNSGLNRTYSDSKSHLRYSTDQLGRDFSLQNYSGGVYNSSKKRYTDLDDHSTSRGYSTSYPKVHHGSSYDDLNHYRNGSYLTENGGKYNSYMDLSYRKVPDTWTHRDPVGKDVLEPRLTKGILKKNQAFLRRHLVLSRSVLDQLVDAGLIGDVMKRRILHMDANSQVPEVIRLLDDRGLGTLRKFLKVLRDTGSGWIADVLLDTDAIEYEELQREEGFDPREHYENRLVRYNHGAMKRYDSADDLTERHQPRNYGSYTARAPSPDSIRYPRVPLYDLLNSKRKIQSDIKGRIRPGFFLSGGADPMTYRGNQTDEVPKILTGLEGHFKSQTDDNEVALSSLKQEEMAIRELMDQNRREQQKVRKNQYTLMDIGQKLKEVNIRTNEIHDPAKNAAVSTYRLSQLNQIPWASGRY
ncbi:uncharacterized protein LOC126831485 [Patella vulgata]|uniref:uncharacterized protein LOC126831485 n=1 Tax=Patella vulgata TaxID=6465 RepID=UPI00218083E3|nr:uncharacterized protein LOC126831485 [Patella vulgata]